MRSLRWLLPLVALAACDVARARPHFHPSPYGVGHGASLRYARVRGNNIFSLSLGSFGYSASYGRAGLFLPPYCAPAFRQTTIIYSPPPLLPPPPPVVPLVVPVAAPVRPAFVNDDLARDVLPRAFFEGKAPEPEVFVKPGRPAPPPPPKPEPPKKEAPPPPGPMPLPPRPQAPEADPRAEYSRLLDLGREAFRALEYGRAADRFRQAIRLEPNRPDAHFLLTQTFVALGKYLDALDQLRTGLGLDPDWLERPFRPIELYGPDVAEYTEQLGRLEQAVARHPNDPALLLLQAYQLWLDGRREQARPLLDRVRQGPDREIVELFLRALPGNPVF